MDSLVFLSQNSRSFQESAKNSEATFDFSSNFSNKYLGYITFILQL